MAYTILLTEKAEKDIIRLQNSGEKLTLKKIDALFDELEQHPTTGTGHPKPLGKERKVNGRGELPKNTALYIKLKRGR